MARALKMDEKSVKRRAAAARRRGARAAAGLPGGRRLNLGIFSKGYKFPRTRRPKARATDTAFHGRKTPPKVVAAVVKKATARVVKKATPKVVKKAAPKAAKKAVAKVVKKAAPRVRKKAVARGGRSRGAA